MRKDCWKMRNILKIALILVLVVYCEVLAATVNVSDIYQCHDQLTCFQLQLLHNLSDIAAAEDVSLTEDLILERVPGAVPPQPPELSVGEVERRLSAGADKELGYLGFALARKALHLLDTHNIKWRMMPGVEVRLFRNEDNGVDVGLETYDVDPDGRTFGFGARKRLMMALLPMMYKMGVMTTMLGGLIILTLKGLAIGVILLVLAMSNLVAKLKYGHGGGYQGGWGHYPGPPIHVHVHSDGHGHKQAYSGWHSGASGPGPSIPLEYHHDR
ncbi:uncharacterized protein [Anabrus simplex]|uniref:uncharacterized protein n=1 Tax=Anabrus simplex TaxID=316456 RepID=UPI0035A3AF3D